MTTPRRRKEPTLTRPQGRTSVKLLRKNSLAKTRSRNRCSPAPVGMHARTLCLAAVLSTSLAHAADDSTTQVRAALADGDVARLAVKTGGKHPGVTLDVGKAKPLVLYEGE